MRWYQSCCAYVRGGSSVFQIVSAIAIFVLKRDVKLQLTNSLFQIFTVTAGVRQDGVLLPVLFNVHVDSFLQRLQSFGLGCRIG